MESQLALPLLINNDDDDFDRDEEVVSQLLNTNERPRTSRRCSYFNITRKRCGAISYALLVCFGLISSIWATASCKLVQIDYNKGGVELTIEGVGFWRYEQKVTNGTHTANYCAPYGQKVHYHQICCACRSAAYDKWNIANASNIFIASLSSNSYDRGIRVAIM